MTRAKYSPNLAAMADDSDGRMPVSEIFSSIQGEGRWSGYPAAFVRLAYCNLGCIWCDTRFTWDKDKFAATERLSPDQVVQKVLKALPLDASRSSVHVVITGGEPMLHQKQIPNLIELLKGAGFGFVEIETNGTIEPTTRMCDVISWWNCSPKLSNNGLPTESNLNESAIRKILSTGRADFKFVIRTGGDIDEVRRDYLPLIPSENIMLMAEGSSVGAQAAAMPVVLEACRQFGFRFSPRLHIMAWGNERGK